MDAPGHKALWRNDFMMDLPFSKPKTPAPHRLALPLALALALAQGLLLGACSSVRTPYQAPPVAVPGAWSHPGAVVTAPADGPDTWWGAFGDPQLNTLVEAALSRNNDLAVAALKVRKARLQAELAERNRWPTLAGSVSTQGQKPLDGGASTRSSGASVSVSYEADLWNRLGSLSDVSRWESLATEQDRQATRLSLIGSVLQAYWQLAYLNQRISTGEQSVAYAEKTRDLVQAQYRAGAVSALEISQAEATVLSQKATLADLQQQRLSARTTLALLLDVAPSDTALQPWLGTEPQRLPLQAMPEVAPGLPAQLLGRRPDLRAAELRLRETLASADATAASYYPALTLTGALGSSSLALGQALSNPYALLGAGVTLPFLQVNTMKLNNAIARTQYESAVVSFRQTLYSALGDVENALSNRSALARQGELLAGSLAASRRSEQLYEVRYRQGSVALNLWLDAQETRRTAETAWAQNQLSQLKNQVTLYLALGGSAQGAP